MAPLHDCKTQDGSIRGKDAPLADNEYLEFCSTESTVSLDTEESKEEMMAHVEEAKRVISLEAEALKELSDMVDMEFGAVIRLFRRTIGRIVVIGVGKSGLIGAKIAATLSSTGSPALFVHACDAAHGDLGMITQEDAVLAISKSGESQELFATIHYTKRFGIPLIGITQNPNSTLGRAARHNLLLPKTEEACGLGVAPTTSSTATLALGDAIAVALMKARGFTVDDFGIFHPGGTLGRLMMRVEDLMHTGDAIPLCQKGATVGEALITMTSKRLGCVGVLDDKMLVGIITDADLAKHMACDLLMQPVHQIMSNKPLVAHPRNISNDVLKAMKKHSTECVFVVDPESNKPVGVIHMADLQEQKDAKNKR